VIAVDSGVPALTSTADVTVQLLDVNDSPPQFSNSNFTATVQVSCGGGGLAVVDAQSVIVLLSSMTILHNG